MKSIKYFCLALCFIIMLVAAQPVMAASHEGKLELSTHSAATCPVEDTQISATLKNLGSETDRYIITSDSSWVTIGADVITLDGGQSKTFPIWIKPKIDAEPGQYIITFTATLDSDSSVKHEDTIDFIVMKCHGIELTPQTELIEACVGEIRTVDVTLLNTGKTAETFTLSSTAGTFDKSTVTIASGAEKTATLSIPVASNDDTITLSAQSTMSYASDSAEIRITSEGACYGIAVLNIPPHVSICKGDTAKIIITTKNIGYKTDSYELSTDAQNANFEKSIISLESKEISETYLEIVTNNMDVGTFDYTVMIESENSKDKAYGKITVDQCYSVEISSEEKSAQVCPGTAATLKVLVENTGKKEDTYTLSVSDGFLSTEEVTVAAGESKEELILINTEQNRTADKTITVTVTSERAEDSIEMTVTTKEFDSCYGVSASSDTDSIFAEDINGYLYTVTVKNDGEFTAEYTITLKGPKWVTVNPEELSLESKESADIFVYASPEYTTAEGTYTIEVNVESDMGATAQKHLQFAFRSDKTIAPITGEIITEDIIDDIEPDVTPDDSDEKRFPTGIITAIIIGIIIILLIIFGPELLKEEEDEKEKDKEKKDKKDEEKKEVKKMEEIKKDIKKSAKPISAPVKKAEVKKPEPAAEKKPVKKTAKKKKPVEKKKPVQKNKKAIRETRKDDIKQILDNI